MRVTMTFTNICVDEEPKLSFFKYFDGLPLQKLMVTHHTKLNLVTSPCQEEQDYNFQAIYMFIIIIISIVVIITSSIIVIAAKKRG